MYKKLIALLLVFIFTLQLPFAGYQKGQVYAAAALPIIAGAGETLTSLICSAAACIGLVVTAKNTSGDLKDMTAEEQKEYYNTVAENNKEAIVKLYNDGYFAGTGMEDAIRDMVAGDDAACAVSLKKVLKDKEMEEEKDIKTYESGKKDDNGKNKPLVAVSGRLLDLLVDVIGDAIGNMIEDKQSSSSDYDDTLVKALPTVPTFSDYVNDVGSYSSRVKTGNYILFRSDTQFYFNRVYEGSHEPGYYIFWYNFTPRFEETYCNMKGAPYEGWQVFMQGNNSNAVSILYRYNEIENKWEILSLNTGGGSSANYAIFYNIEETFIKLFYNQNLNWEKTENSKTTRFVVPANPIPDMFDLQPPTTTEIVNNYFGDEITNFYEDVYNYTTNNSNNYFTENNYLLPVDPADVAKDIILPTQTVINNTYNSIDPSVTVDEDYINNVLIPSIVAGINANLKLNTDVNLPDMTIDNVMDFTGNGSDDDRWDKVTFWGLEKKFPFCLPFDLYDFLSILDAEPRAPAFTVVIPLSSFGFGLKDVSFEVDLSHFDEVMQILRTMELLGSVVGLIFITKKILF